MSIPGIRLIGGQDGNSYAVFETYDHFKQSGFAAGSDDDVAIYGEVHGGASPEEMLVPVFVLDSNKEVPLIGTWEKQTVKISMKKVCLRIKFNQPVNELVVKISGELGVSRQLESSDSWEIVFSGVRKGTYLPQVFANGRNVDVSEITVIPALGGGEGDLP